MRFAVLGPIAFIATLAVAGCPIYSGESRHRVCDNKTCYDCPDETYSTACVSWACGPSSNCPDSFVCNTGHQCVVPLQGVGNACEKPSDCSVGLTCGAAKRCDTRDCTVVGCSPSFICRLASGAPSCSALPSATDANDAGSTADAAPADASQADSGVQGGDGGNGGT